MSDDIEEIDTDSEEMEDSQPKMVNIEKVKAEVLEDRSKRISRPRKKINLGSLESKSCEELSKIQKDEEEAVGMWVDLGVPEFGKDEHKHQKRVEKAMKMKKCDLIK